MNELNIPTFLLHHPALVDRKVYLEKRLQELNIDPIWITNFSPEDIDIPEDSNFKNKGEYSLYLKHQYCFEQQIKNNYQYIIIMEDDILIPDDYHEHIKTCLAEFEQINGDLLFVGICCNIKPNNIIEGKHVYWQSEFRTRCTHCYITTLNAAQKIMKHFKSKQRAADWKLNEIIETENLKSCYSEPGWHQGSHGGQYQGTLNN